MKLRGRELGEYYGAFRVPFTVYFVWVLVSFLSSFTAFEVYLVVGALSFVVALGLGLYVGWSSGNRGFDMAQSLIAGGFFGILVGIVDGLGDALLVTQNSSVTALYEESIQGIMSVHGDATRHEIVTTMAFMMLIMGPVVWFFIMAALSAIGSVVAKHVGRREGDKPKPKNPSKRRKRR